MSEPIQSIAQNNYILHNVDAKKLYVQEPLFTANSGDAVYVGWRPDETVLWSGTNVGTAEITLSESYKNFDRIGIEIQSNAAGNIAYSEILGSSKFAVPWTDNYDGGWFMLNWYGQFSANAENNKIKLTSCRFIGYQREGQNTTCGSNTNDIRVYKIVGINRKENA